MPAALPLAAALLLHAPPGKADSPPAVDVAGDQQDIQTVAGRTAEQWAAELGDADRVVRCRAALSLRAFGPAGAAHLADALVSDDGAVRFWAAEGLGMTPDAPAARDAEPRLREMMTAGDTAERLAAAFEVAKLGGTDDALPVLVGGLAHPSRGVAVTAADLLARLGPAAGPVGETLRQTALTHDDYHVRYRSAQAFAAATGGRIPTAEIMR